MARALRWLMPHPLLTLILAVVWVLLQNDVTAGMVVFGIILCGQQKNIKGMPLHVADVVEKAVDFLPRQLVPALEDATVGCARDLEMSQIP